ncbi:MAG TPA: DUF1993 domain-containing protein [Candidatus Paceibacterota bacterium]|nr:DUF1993 domain-containing protein [Candidatus Paceibacterota bacterium]
MDSIYEFTIPVFIKMLGGLKGVLKKAGEHGLDEATLLNDKLAPDMFPLVKQVQVATDNAKGVAARLSGTEVPKYEDTETTLAELDTRIDKTIAYLNTVTKESFANAANVQVTLPYFPGKFMTGYDYAREYAIPNFFFHVATAYGIIRKNGVQIGKADYMNNSLPLQDM